MRYDISKQTAPAMPNLGKGTECIKLLLSQVSKDMHDPFVPMFFPVLGAHISGAEFQYPDNSWKEPTGMMANLVANSGDNKGQLTTLAKAICRDFRQHDEAEEKKLLEWQKQKNTKGANKDKPDRPDVAFRFPPSNTTNAAFIQNAMALEAQGGLTQYFNLPEVEMADRLCGGHRQVSVLLRVTKGPSLCDIITRHYRAVMVGYFFMKKNGKKIAYFKNYLYLCKVIKEMITSGIWPPGVVGQDEYLIPQKTRHKV